MSAYLQFFELEQSPFEGTDQSKVVLGTKALREAFATIQTGLDEGASRIFLNGGPGVGKSSFARALPKLLGDETRVAGVSDPSLPWESLRGGIAMQWGLDKRGLARASLLEAAEDHRLLLVVDQAETASEDFLDHLDVLLSYRDEFADPVVQSVLLGQLSGAGATSAPPLMWWLDRIQTLQLEYAPLPREGVGPYIRKHLKRAGWRGGRLFTDDAALAIHGWTGGIPAQVSALCERLLVAAADCGIESIDANFVDLYGEEEPWNFDHEFDEFENKTQSELSASDGNPEIHSSTETLTDESQETSPEPNESDSPADLAPSSDRSLLQEEQDRLASQKAALPSAPTERLETALEHFETIQILEENRPNIQNETADVNHLTAEETGIQEENGFDPNAQIDRETSAQLDALEQVLAEPPSAAELHKIRGGFLAQYAKPLALGTLAAVIGGLAFAFLFNSPTEEKGSDSQADTPPMLGRVNGPADGMPTAPKPVVRLRENAQREAPTPAPQRQSSNPTPSSNDVLAGVGPRLRQAPPALSGKSQTQKQLESEQREEVFEDLRPQGLNSSEIDLSENRNR